MDARVQPVPALVPAGDSVGAWMAARLTAGDAKDTPPFLSFLLRNCLVADYRTYVDASPLYPSA